MGKITFYGLCPAHCLKYGLKHKFFLNKNNKDHFRSKEVLKNSFEMLSNYRGNIIHNGFVDNQSENKRKRVEGIIGQI